MSCSGLSGPNAGETGLGNTSKRCCCRHVLAVVTGAVASASMTAKCLVAWLGMHLWNLVVTDVSFPVSVARQDQKSHKNNMIGFILGCIIGCIMGCIIGCIICCVIGCIVGYQ